MADMNLMRTPWVGKAELGILAKMTAIHASVMLSYVMAKRSLGTHSLLSTTVVYGIIELFVCLASVTLPLFYVRKCDIKLFAHFVRFSSTFLNH